MKICIKLSEAVEESIIVVTNDINSVSGDWVAAQYQADDLDEDIAIDVPESNIERLIVNKEEVAKVIDHINTNHIDIVNRFKNRQFKREHELTNADIKYIIRQLAVEDYSYSLESENDIHLGNVLTVFITGKEFILTDGRTLNNLVLYIKVDDSAEGLVTIISIHEATHPEEESHPYAEEFKEYENLWNEN